jgi:starch synthase (maltosyl-transferring)
MQGFALCDLRQGDHVAMPAESMSNALRPEPRPTFAPKLYYFRPVLAGPAGAWPQHLRRVQGMGFDTVLSAPLFAPGVAGDILTAHHERTHPVVRAAPSIDQAVHEFADLCHRHDLQLYLHVVLGRVAIDARLATAAPDWFRTVKTSEHVIDPRASVVEPDACYARFDDPSAAKQLAAWWVERLSCLARAGVSGFVCQDLHLVTPQIWRYIIAALRHSSPSCRFLAWTPGHAWSCIAGLRNVGFDGAFSSVAWWDGRAAWFVEEHELLRSIGAVIGCPEPPFGPRLARRLEDTSKQRATYRHMLMRAVATGDGLLVPMGFEFAAERDMAGEGAEDLDTLQAPRISSLAADINEANALAVKLAAIGLRGEMRPLSETGQAITVLLRSDAQNIRDTHNAVAVLINPELSSTVDLSVTLNPLPPAAGTALIADQVLYGERGAAEPLNGGEVRVVRTRRTAPMQLSPTAMSPTELAALPRIVIDKISPAVDGGRFAARRVIGEAVSIEADVFTDGHELIAVEMLWRAADEKDWRHVLMRHLGNDRWQAVMHPDRIGRYAFTIQAWWDAYGTFCRDLEVKRKAGADLGVEIAEGRELLERVKSRSSRDVGKVIGSALNWLRDASIESAAEILLAADLREVMRAAEEKGFLRRYESVLTIDVERPQARFAAWYELFPRSATNSPQRHGTFTDVIGRLPAIQDMGFDVLYLTPIHPIGRKNRKGKNNNLRGEPADVGSPYAIGGVEGGHDVIHPELGTIEDFRGLRDAAKEHGLELALDFAIQCSPEHPWIREHPEWFNWRPDGSVRYAENPPKKYEDIVNVDFYATAEVPHLWFALRDIVLFWVEEGVRIFRVDNPHTKPLPFWEWLIAHVRTRHADVIFLSEAFTRPKMMYRLAKVGFSQSYTYFTWRNSKQELIDYFIELTTSEVKDFFRPHLFVNTPDINPYFLQTSGRPGFLIRAALAATLSGLWGMYSGFELCEAAALPGREEYLHSEKYEIRVRDYEAPGNIVAEIAKLNRIRKTYLALQDHLGLRFYPAHNDQIVLYGKPLPARGDIILIAVSLDPFHVQEATIEVPLWEWGFPDNASVTVRDLMHDADLTWHGKLQRIRLDPADLPFAIWRVRPQAGG